MSRWGGLAEKVQEYTESASSPLTPEQRMALIGAILGLGMSIDAMGLDNVLDRLKEESK